MEITFDELNISRDSKTLSVDATVTNDTGENYIITNISVDTCATFNEMLGHPSSKAIVSQDFSAPSARMVVNDDYIFQNKILFVWVTVQDGFNIVYRLTAVLNWYKVYQTAMCFVKHVPCKNCKPPVGFVDFILKTKGIDYALQTGNYTQAIRLWKTLYTKKSSSLSSEDCGCGCS